MIEVRLPRVVIFESSILDGVGICVIFTVDGRLGVTSMYMERDGSPMLGDLNDRHHKQSER